MVEIGFDVSNLAILTKKGSEGSEICESCCQPPPSGYASVWAITNDVAPSIIWSYDTFTHGNHIAVNIAGRILTVGARIYNKNVWCLNSDGILQWFYDTGGGQARGVSSGPNGYIAIGTDRDLSTKQESLMVLDSNGLYSWGKALPTNSGWVVHYGKGTAMNGSGDVWIIATAYSDLWHNFWRLFHYHSDGSYQWRAINEAWIGEYPTCICIDGSGNCYMGGLLAYFFMYDADGIGIWSERFLETSAEARGMFVDTSGNIYIAHTRSLNTSVRKFDSDRNLQWTYDTGNTAMGITVDADGNVYVVGYHSGGKSFWKLDSDGVLVASWDSGGDLFGIAIGYASGQTVWDVGHGVYYVNDVVTYLGSTYKCILQHSAAVGKEPTNTTYWEKLSDSAIFVCGERAAVP